MKPTLDENGRLIPREDYRISSLNCGGGDFAVACMRANLRSEKNQKREDVKRHHYLISFDPRDGTDNALTLSLIHIWRNDGGIPGDGALSAHPALFGKPGADAALPVGGLVSACDIRCLKL